MDCWSIEFRGALDKCSHSFSVTSFWFSDRSGCFLSLTGGFWSLHNQLLLLLLSIDLLGQLSKSLRTIRLLYVRGDFLRMVHFRERQLFLRTKARAHSFKRYWFIVWFDFLYLKSLEVTGEFQLLIETTDFGDIDKASIGFTMGRGNCNFRLAMIIVVELAEMACIRAFISEQWAGSLSV